MLLWDKWVLLAVMRKKEKGVITLLRLFIYLLISFYESRLKLKCFINIYFFRKIEMKIEITANSPFWGDEQRNRTHETRRIGRWIGSNRAPERLAEATESPRRARREACSCIVRS